jgi:hypothetical protein
VRTRVKLCESVTEGLEFDNVNPIGCKIFLYLSHIDEYIIYTLVFHTYIPRQRVIHVLGIPLCLIELYNCSR